VRNLLPLAAAILLTAQEPAKLVEGVYSLCEEVSGYSGEVVELKDGKFRYWFYSDVSGGGEEPKYPLTGDYRIAGDTLTLAHDQIRSKDRTIAVVNGADVLWRDDGLKLWKKEQRIHPYAILIRMPGLKDGSKVHDRPRLEILYTKEMKEREKKEYEERYHDAPAEARLLLRARSREGDPQMQEYKKEIAAAREQPDPKLVAQLIGLLHRDSPAAIEAHSILEDLYQESFLIRPEPPFLKNPAAKEKALGTLIDALSSAKDRYALQETLMLFLRVTGTAKIDLEVPETGHRIKLATLPSGGSYGSEGTAADDVSWLKSMSKLIPACQKWMREQIQK
jgi:hypothetical protein